MAKTDNFFNIRGRMGQLIFYVRNGNTFIKPYSGGFTRKEAQNHPNVRQYQERFAQIARFVKSFKQGLYPYLWRQKDSSFHNQLMATFSQLSKRNPEVLFEEVVRSEANYEGLKRKPLNKNSKLPTHSLDYDTGANTLNIGHLPYLFPDKYKGNYLEVAMGWYSICQGLAHFSKPVLEYVRLDESSLYSQITLNFPEKDKPEAILPFVGLAVVVEPHSESPSLHPFHSLAACFCRR